MENVLKIKEFKSFLLNEKRKNIPQWESLDEKENNSKELRFLLMCKNNITLVIGCLTCLDLDKIYLSSNNSICKCKNHKYQTQYLKNVICFKETVCFDVVLSTESQKFVYNKIPLFNCNKRRKNLKNKKRTKEKYPTQLLNIFLCFINKNKTIPLQIIFKNLYICSYKIDNLPYYQKLESKKSWHPYEQEKEFSFHQKLYNPNESFITNNSGNFNLSEWIQSYLIKTNFSFESFGGNPQIHSPKYSVLKNKTFKRRRRSLNLLDFSSKSTKNNIVSKDHFNESYASSFNFSTIIRSSKLPSKTSLQNEFRTLPAGNVLNGSAMLEFRSKDELFLQNETFSEKNANEISFQNDESSPHSESSNTSNSKDQAGKTIIVSDNQVSNYYFFI